MSEATHAHDHGGHHSEAHYKKIWGVLLALLVVSVVGPMLEIRIITLLTAFGIAFVKAFLVMKHFMHLDVEKPIVRYILTTALVFMVLMFAGVSVDVMEHEGRGWENVAAKAETARVQKLAAEGKLDGHHGEDSHEGEHTEGGEHKEGH